jgi:hypothetical protein
MIAARPVVAPTLTIRISPSVGAHRSSAFLKSFSEINPAPSSVTNPLRICLAESSGYPSA